MPPSAAAAPPDAAVRTFEAAPPVAEAAARRPTRAPADPEAAARRELRRQVADLERRLSDVALATFPYGAGAGAVAAPAPERPAAPGRGPRLLGLGELEVLRDELALRLDDARAALAELGARQEAARGRLERMLRDPGRHRFARVANAELGEPGCGVWQVRPRLGLLGMLAGWWEVRLSSGCPLGPGHPRPR
jgi:hypothetical protein